LDGFLEGRLFSVGLFICLSELNIPITFFAVKLLTKLVERALG
jgi:hypothetical protein